MLCEAISTRDLALYILLTLHRESAMLAHGLPRSLPIKVAIANQSAYLALTGRLKLDLWAVLGIQVGALTSPWKQCGQGRAVWMGI